MGVRHITGTLVRVCVPFAVLLLFTAGVHRAYSVIPVTVDGSHVLARRGVSAGELAAEYSPALPGDLRSAAERRVVIAGGGDPVLITVNGRLVDARERVGVGDTVKVFDGSDVTEPTFVETRTVEPSVSSIGRGPIEHIVSEGAAGVCVVTVGEVSGDVVASETVTPAAPRIVRRIPLPGARVVALTFDDGPWPGQTDALLEILAKRDVPATFFMLGSRVKAAPEVASRIYESGHLLGNHSFRHRRFDEISAEAMRSEIRRANSEIEQATGVVPRWFRAPGGHMTKAAYTEIGHLGMRTALWTVDPADWRDDVPASTIVNDVLKAAEPGAIILLHDGGGEQPQTLIALPLIIDGLRARGYEFVTLDELTSVRSRW
jgi:peptidoglycan/xylan/chitin deacetylase (PgdA/CDA1 family)